MLREFERMGTLGFHLGKGGKCVAAQIVDDVLTPVEEDKSQTIRSTNVRRIVASVVQPRSSVHKILRKARHVIQLQCITSKDDASPYIACCVKQVLHRHFGDDRIISWPFPTAFDDSNPYNFWLWRYLKAMVYRDPIISLSNLEESVECHVHNIPQFMLLSAVEHAILRFQMVTDNGGHEEIEAFLAKEPTILHNCITARGIISKENIPTLRDCKCFSSIDGKDYSLPNKQWEILVGQQIYTLPLPNIIKKEVTALVKLVFLEYDKWLYDHARIMHTMMDTTNLQQLFHWTQDNKIDRLKTAKAIIADNNMDTRGRFMLACHYCFQEDVFSIWGILDDTQQNLLQESSFDIVRMWANWAKNREELHWEEIARISERNAFSLRTYLPKLKKEKRLEYLMHQRRRKWIDYHEMQFCLSQLDQTQQNEIFRKCPLQVLEIFLDWPVQDKLLDVAELLWPYLSEQDLRGFFHMLLCQKYMLDWIEFPYVTLVKKLWKRVPSKCRKFIEMDTIYNALKLVLEYDGSYPFPHGLRVHSNTVSYMAFHTAGTMFVISRHAKPIHNLALNLSHVFPLYDRISLICFG
ncbi:uncharacterized protein TNCV_320091 [Trichonephila clavipes]|nr:uncharacterized protein TNCV_320091 [Trichonephila clavipes]